MELISEKNTESQLFPHCSISGKSVACRLVMISCLRKGTRLLFESADYDLTGHQWNHLLSNSVLMVR